MKNESVKDACTKLGMDPVCYSSSSTLNVDGCIHTAKGGQTMQVISELLCGHRNPGQCSAIFGLFVSMKNWNGGSECGVLDGRYCSNGNAYTSGPGWVYTHTTKIGQYYGICAVKKWEQDIEEKLTEKITESRLSIFNMQGKI